MPLARYAESTFNSLLQNNLIYVYQIFCNNDFNSKCGSLSDSNSNLKSNYLENINDINDNNYYNNNNSPKEN